MCTVRSTAHSNWLKADISKGKMKKKKKKKNRVKIRETRTEKVGKKVFKRSRAVLLIMAPPRA